MMVLYSKAKKYHTLKDYRFFFIENDKIRQGNGCAHLVNWVISNFSIYINSIHVWLLHIESSKKSHFGKDAIYSA